MHDAKLLRPQRGAALIVGLILLLVGSIVALASMRGSTLQEGMTANLNNKAISFMAAEAGATAFWQWLSTGGFDWEDDSWHDDWQQAGIPTDDAEAQNMGDFGHFWIDPAEVLWSASAVTVTVNGLSRLGADAPIAETRLRLEFALPTPGDVLPAFRAGLLSDHDITINGDATLTGSAHANGDFTNMSGSSTLNDRSGTDADGNPITLASTVSAHGDVTMHHDVGTAESKLSNVPQIDVPSAADHIAANMGNAGVINSCTIPAGDGGGAVYYCDGNATTSGDFANVTIMASGNVTHNGAAQLGGDGALTVAIIAGGNITVNGSNDTYGVFWADGTVTQNGSSVLGGAIVAGGSITRNGTFNYTQYDNFGNLLLPLGPDTPLSIQTWAEHIE